MRFLLLIVAACGFIVPALADEPIEQAPVDESEMGAGLAMSNGELPPGTPHRAGELTLFADFGFANKEGVPLYVINATAQPVVFESLGSDIYLKLERQRPDGRWERAQTQQYSFCGNAYGHVTLPAGQHLRLRGYMPTRGEKSRVRFSSYGSEKLTSNEGDGFVLPEVVRAAQVDDMAKMVPHHLGEFLDPEYWRPSKPPTPGEQVVALRLLQTYEDNVYYKRHAESLAHDWEAKANASEQETRAAKATREILAGKWPVERDTAALRDRCVLALSHPDGSETAFGSPEQNPAVTWMVLSSLVESEFLYSRRDRQRMPVDPDAWKPVADLVMATSGTSDFWKRAGSLGIAGIAPFADLLLPDRFFEENMTRGEWATRIAAGALARRKRWTTTANLARDLSPKDQAQVLGILSRSGDEVGASRPRNPEPGDEERFWRHCLATFPAECCWQLTLGQSNISDPWQHNPYNRVVHDALREYFVREADRGAAVEADFDLGADGNQLKCAVSLLASWNLDEDTPILQRLLAYRGYWAKRYSGTDPDHPEKMRNFAFRVYVAREPAKAALQKRGVTVPADLIVEKETAP